MPFNYKTELHRYKRYYQSLEQVANKPTAHAFTAAIFSFLAVSLFGWYAIRPTLQTILFLQKEIEDNKIVNLQMEEKIGSLIEAHARFQSVEADLPYVTQSLPEAPEALTALGQIRNIAHLRGASVSAITSSGAPLLAKSAAAPNPKSSPIRSVPTSKIQSVQLSVALVGTYEVLKAVIEDILSMRRLVSTETLSMTIEGDVENQLAFGSIPLKLVLKLNAHYLERQ